MQHVVLRFLSSVLVQEEATHLDGLLVSVPHSNNLSQMNGIPKLQSRKVRHTIVPDKYCDRLSPACILQCTPNEGYNLIRFSHPNSLPTCDLLSGLEFPCEVEASVPTVDPI